MTNAINWFEIPVTDFARAKKFYETVLNIKIMEMPFPHGKYGMFPFDMEKGGVGGGLTHREIGIRMALACLARSPERPH